MAVDMTLVQLVASIVASAIAYALAKSGKQIWRPILAFILGWIVGGIAGFFLGMAFFKGDTVDVQIRVWGTTFWMALIFSGVGVFIGRREAMVGANETKNMFCPQCGSENQPAARFCQKCGGALSSAPAQETASIQPQATEAAIWNPNATANWSLIFTPAFGAYLQMLNWRGLGETEKAASSQNWFYVGLGMLAAYVLMGVFMSDSKAAYDAARGLGFLFLLVWYFSSGRSQSKYVKEKFGTTYAKKPWGKALLIGVGAIVGYFIAAVVTTAVMTSKRNLESQGWSQENTNSRDAQTPPTPAVQTPNPTQGTILQYTKPAVGTDIVLSVPEIRWCIRESIRIDAMRDVIYTSTGIDELNLIINDYNSRCRSYRYHEDSQSQAERDVDAYRRQIISEALGYARDINARIQTSVPSGSIADVTDSWKSIGPSNPSAEQTKEAQKLLANLGYSPGPVDGVFGQRTVEAVKAFQSDNGTYQNGGIDENLILLLRQIASQRPNYTASTNTESTGLLGVRTNDLLRIFGEPDDIVRYPSNVEVWIYGQSSVRVASREQRVLSVDDRGNLQTR